ncbi:hypothetical protein CR205_16065 [Alteribacter lacisalsi]|jgi:hypothetical protein|uniref:Uncharacterized protein n=1 Tax=Alteribacter lacisalsi TaxID=2045244 RepID=A0A2W0H281_9BACI|nr:hypothetical protein [Alteribacter lacisalsi]PYZ95893.1 hypothetical protein CR205_16065 [Alteribacter lacisalsi]
MFKLFKASPLNEKEYVQCPNCRSIHKDSKWNEIAVATYGPDSPDVKEAARNKAVSFPFQCPTCYMGFSAWKLTLLDKDEIEKLKPRRL